MDAPRSWELSTQEQLVESERSCRVLCEKIGILEEELDRTRIQRDVLRKRLRRLLEHLKAEGYTLPWWW